MKTINCFRILFIVTFASLMVTSCSTYKKVKNKDLVKINESFQNNYNAISFSKDSTENNRKTSLQDLFGISNNSSNLLIKINDNSELEIQFKNVLGGKESRYFKGKFKKKYFEIYLEKKRIPFAPIYNIIQVNRFRVSLDKNNNIIIDHYFNHSGMILMMAGGTIYKEQFQFQSIKK